MNMKKIIKKNEIEDFESNIDEFQNKSFLLLNLMIRNIVFGLYRKKL